MNTKAVFLDKDGTLIENVPYNVDPEKIRLAEGAIEGLQLLHEAGYQLIVITNQSGVAHGRFEEKALEAVEERLRQLLAVGNVPLTDFYYCPHHPDGSISSYAINCFCRKPNPGLIFQAAREHNLNLASSWFIGDILNDIEAGNRADCQTIHLDNKNETEWNMLPLRRPHYTVKSITEAVKLILTMGKPKVVQPGAIPPLPVKVQKIALKIQPVSKNGNGAKEQATRFGQMARSERVTSPNQKTGLAQKTGAARTIAPVNKR